MSDNLYDNVYLKDLVGANFGNWKVLDYAGKNTSNQRKYLCRCEGCGKTERVIPLYALKNGSTTSCGCSRDMRMERAELIKVADETIEQRVRELYNMFIELREDMQIPQADLAEALGVAQPAVVQFEQRRVSHKLKTWLQFLAPLGYTLEIVKKKRKD